MQYKKIKNTSIRVSAIGVGGNVFGHFSDVSETKELLAAAQDFGINLIDTSDSYSGGLSEKFIGKAIRANRHRWIIATKCGVGSNESPSGLGRRENIIKKVYASLIRLGIDFLDFYQMHHFDPDTPLDETVLALADCVKVGKIRHIGVSNYSAKQLIDISDCAKSYGSVSISSAQCHFNMFRHEASVDFLPLCRSRDIGVFVYGVLARGVLGGKYATDFPPPAGSRAHSSYSIRSDLSSSVLQAVGELKQYSDLLGVSIARLATAWTLSNEFVTSAIVGLRDKSQLCDIAAAVDVHIPSEVMDAIALRMQTWGSSSKEHLGGMVDF